MDTQAVVLWSAVTGLLSALATGLGAVPVAFLEDRSVRMRAFAEATAAGMMISASVFSMAQNGIAMQSRRASAPYEVILGLMAGAAFFWWVQKRTAPAEPTPSRRGFLIFLAMLIHSIPEGVAIGVGFATGDFGFGLLMALAIAVHNIPEGIAISLPMRSEGASLGRCAGMSVLSSMPQPLFAVPAALLAWLFQPLLALGLGFAGGAMMYLAVSELIPDAVEEGGRTLAAWGVMCGLSGMLLATTLLDAATLPTP